MNCVGLLHPLLVSLRWSCVLGVVWFLRLLLLRFWGISWSFTLRMALVRLVPLVPDICTRTRGVGRARTMRALAT